MIFKAKTAEGVSEAVHNLIQSAKAPAAAVSPNPLPPDEDNSQDSHVRKPVPVYWNEFHGKHSITTSYNRMLQSELFTQQKKMKQS